MSLLDDTSLDDRALLVLGKGERPETSDESLRAAMMLADEMSPAMLKSMATWLEIVDDLKQAELTPEMILRVALRACVDKYEVSGPFGATLVPLFAIEGGLEIARALCDELTAPGAAPDRSLRSMAVVALARLANAGPLEARYERLFTWDAKPLAVVRDLLAALPAARREALLLGDVPATFGTPRVAEDVLDRLLAVRDLVDGPALAALRATALGVATATVSPSKVAVRLAAEVAAGAPRIVPTRPTKRALAAFEYLQEEREEKRREESIGPLAEETWARFIAVDASELVSMSMWTAASETRQGEIAAAVAAAVGAGCTVTGHIGVHRIAVLELDGLPYCLVPGGTVEMGFSPEEEAAVRAASAAAGDHGNHYELYDSLLEQLGMLRPLTLVHVGPMLAAQEPRKPISAVKGAHELESSRFRVPSEAEWEYLARGGVPREPTYRGAGVPDDPQWLPTNGALGLGGANAFGMWGFGFEPELCADVWHPSHEGALLNGAPRRGTGPRVIRGGAAQLYPFQDTGEWHLLLSAMRTDQKTWEFGQSLRWVLGIRLPRRS